MRVLVTGGAGYIGAHVVRALLRKEFEVIVADNCSRGHWDAVPLRGRHEVDLTDRRGLSDLFRWKKFDAVIHLAGSSMVGEAETNPGLYYQQNVANTINLLEAMQANRVWRIVFSSSAAVYGPTDKLLIDEKTPLQPYSIYGRTKRMVEQILADYTQAHEFSHVALRYFNAAGASADGQLGEDHTPETHLIPIALQVALGQREHMWIYGNDHATKDGTCVRDYVHVEDLAEGHVQALSRLGHFGPGMSMKLNLGTGQGSSVQEVIETCRKVTGLPIPAVITASRDGDPARLVADPRRAEIELGWEPKYTSLTRIIETAWQWHKNHPNGYRR